MSEGLSTSPNWSTLSSSPKWGFLSSQPAHRSSPWGDDGLGGGGGGEEPIWSSSGNEENAHDAEGCLSGGVQRLKAEEFEKRWIPPAVTAIMQELGDGAGPAAGGARADVLEHLRRLLRGVGTPRETARQAVMPHLPALALLAHTAPFPAIRNDFGQLCAFIEKELGLKPPPAHRISYFVANSDITPLDPEDVHTRRLFCNIFMQTGKLTHLMRVLGWHTSYLERAFQTINLVMRSSGPLPFHMRNYIAILAASQFRCQYLVTHQEQEFLQNGGEPSWLKGIDYAPKKITNLLELNAILAHEPWRVKRDHIAVLVKGTDAWSIGELVHGLVIMASYRSLAGIVFGCGVAPEADIQLPELDLDDDDEDSPRSRRALRDNPVHETVRILQALKEAVPSPSPEPALQARRLVFENAGSEDPLDSDDEDEDSGSIRSRSGKLSRYLGPYQRSHADFDVHSKDYSVFRVQDYSWKEHGYALVSRFYEDAAPLLDDQFDHIYYMTYNTISSHTNVDTAPFRESIWYYVHRIHGLLHEDYDYRNVNTYMNRAIKQFVKKVACFPERITRNDFENIGVDLRPEEKCHVALLAAEARKQAELLYGLHGVMQHMT